MFKISLVNMPFANLNLPSIGLTQLKSVIDERFGDKVSVEICYANQDFGRYLQPKPYQFVASSMESHTSGLGEWFFRRVAFPDLSDNIDDYFRRFFPYHNEQTKMYRTFIEQKRMGFETFLDELIDTYRLDQSDIVGFTSMFTQNVSSLAMMRKLKTRRPDIITVMGGANCESPMGQELIKNTDCLDFVFSGPALKSFPQFLDHLFEGQSELCHRINGVFSKANCSAAVPQATIGRTFTPVGIIGDELELDELTELDYDDFLDRVDKNFPNHDVQPNLLFETSRGCWWGEKAHCTFCGLNGMTMNYRLMRPENAVKIITSLFKYSSRCSRISSVDNILPKEYLKEVLPFLETPKTMSLFYEVKSDLSEEDVQTLANARVKSIQPGIESLATSTLKLMKKGSTAFQNIRLLKNCLMYDVSPEWNLLIGFPGEGEDVYKKYVADLPLLTHLPPPSGVYPVRFDRYSPYFMQAKQYELDLAPVDYYQFIYPYAPETLSNLAYYFMDRNTSAKYFISMVKWIGKIKEKFEPWNTQWHKPPAERPALYFKQKGNPTIIYDSRSGKESEYKVGATGAQLLDLMAARPREKTGLAKELAHVPHLDIDKEMAWLQERGLLFHEGERFVSLVLPKEPTSRSSTRIGGFGL